MIWRRRQRHRQAMWPFARPVCQAHGVVDGAHCVQNMLMPPPGRVPLPPRPPHARLLDPLIVPLLRRQSPLPPPTGQLSPVLRRCSSLRDAGTWVCQGRSSVLCPLAFNTSCGGAARWGASWWGRLPCPLPQSNYYLV